MTHPASEKKPKTQKVRQNEMAEKHVSGKHDNAQEQVNELKTGNLPEKELRVMIVKMMQDLGIRLEA